MTTQEKRTPGPWYVHNAANIAEQGLIVSEVTPDTVAVSYRHADAALLAAAPDLLAALRDLEQIARQQLDQSATNDGLNNCALLSMARSAIAKAEGRAE